jgi:hypothetical protein
LLNENPYISTVNNAYEDAETKIFLNETSKIVMSVYNFTMVPMDIQKDKLHLWVDRVTEYEDTK